MRITGNKSAAGASGRSIEQLLAEADSALARMEATGSHRHGKKDGGAAAYTVTMTSAGGHVTGYAATFDRIADSYGDVIAKGAFERTLREWKAKGFPIPLLYGHRTDDPQFNIGRVLDAREDGRGLLVKAVFDADNPVAQYVRKLAMEGRLYQFSFAYEIKSSRRVKLPDGSNATELLDVDLFEVSLVQVPANQRAVITSVKSQGARDEELESARAMARAMLYAIEALNK